MWIVIFCVILLGFWLWFSNRRETMTEIIGYDSEDKKQTQHAPRIVKGKNGVEDITFWDGSRLTIGPYGDKWYVFRIGTDGILKKTPLAQGSEETVRRFVDEQIEKNI